jgi:hypothetical protein
MVLRILVPGRALLETIEGGKPASNSSEMLLGDAGRLYLRELRLVRSAP